MSWVSNAIKVDSVQVSSKLRRATNAHAHWCPACQELHMLPDSGWSFNGDLDQPTFAPSFRHTTGTEGADVVCHYTLTDGVLNYCSDCTHDLKDHVVPLPDLPPQLCDEGFVR